MFCVDNVDNLVNSDETGIISVDNFVENESAMMSNWDGHLLTGDGFYSLMLKTF